MSDGTKPLVSVIMPVYNAERYIREAIDSILAQTCTDWELILIDDASRDRSAEVAKAYAAQDRRIRYYANEVNLGVAKTRNRALSLARGEFVAPLDNDDVALPTRLEEQVRFLRTHQDHALVASDLEIIDEESRRVAMRTYPHRDEEIRASLSRMNPIANPASMFRRSAFLALGGTYDETVCPVEDYEFVTRIALQFKLANLDRRLTRYRISATQAKSVYLKRTLRMTLLIQQRALAAGLTDSLRNRLHRGGLRVLLLLPDRFVMWLFKMISFSGA